MLQKKEEEKNKLKQILKENTDNFDNDLEKEEDSREIYQMFEQKLNQRNPLNKFNNKDQVIQGRNQVQSKLINNNMNLNMNNTPKIKDIQKNEDMKLKFNSYQNIQEKENSNKKY